MKYFVKQLDGFCVTYLHNPYECSNCVKLIESDDTFKKTFYAFYPEESRAREISDVDRTSVPLNNLHPKTKTVSKDTNLLQPLQLKSSPLNPCKLSKRKKISPCSTSTNFGNGNKVKSVVPKASKKTPSDKLNSIKKQTSKSVHKSSGDKIPGKGTLKRKRWFMERLQQKNENYEDDLFEDKKFGHFQNLLEDESDNPETDNGMKTPVFPFSLSPRQNTPSPDYLDCYDYEQLSIVRKRGEEYQYHLKKKKKLGLFPSKKEENQQTVKEEKSDNFDEQLLQVAKLLKMTDEENDIEEDPYFSDLLK